MPQRPYDVAVLGLGAMGAAAAHSLAAAGLRVVGLDRYHPPHDLGSSHGLSRVIRQAYFEDPAYVPLAIEAYERWRKLERDSGEGLLRITGALMLGPPASPVVTGTLRAAREHGLGHEVLEGTALTRRFSPFRPSDPTTVGVYETQGGALIPEAAIRAQLRLAARRGAELRFDQGVQGWSGGDGEEIVLETGIGRVRARQLVVTAGPWVSELLAWAEVPITVTRQPVLWLAPSAGLAGFLPDIFPVWVWEPATGPTFYGMPALEGFRGGVKVGVHTLGEACTPDSVERALKPADEEPFHTFLSENIPDLDGRLLRGGACLYSNTPDGHFLLGPHPQRSGVFVAAGFSGHGFKFSPLVGEILRDLILEGRTQLPVELFSPARFAKFSAPGDPGAA